jgi:hypothetical protein
MQQGNTNWSVGPLWLKCDAVASANAQACGSIKSDYCTHDGSKKEHIYDCDGDGNVKPLIM